MTRGDQYLVEVTFRLGANTGRYMQQRLIKCHVK